MPAEHRPAEPAPRELRMEPSRAGRALLMATPGALLAAVDLTHPHHLDAAGAGWWRDMHILLAFVFPLLGVVIWMLMEPAWGPVRWLGRLAAFGYAVLYGALDAIAGIGGGAMAAVQGGRTPLLDPLFRVGNDLGYVGAWCFVVGAGLAAATTIRHAGRGAVPGGFLVLAAGVVFLDSHIYWPAGVLAMCGIAIGFAQLGWVGSVRTPHGKGAHPALPRPLPRAAVTERP